jgi:hypothetical protein
MRHIRALQPTHVLLETALDAHSIHEQHATVHGDPALAMVIATWPTLAETVWATVLQLIATEEVREWIPYSHPASMPLTWHGIDLFWIACCLAHSG